MSQIVSRSPPDCAPAGYPVAGERKDGILVLEGLAPQRAPAVPKDERRFNALLHRLVRKL